VLASFGVAGSAPEARKARACAASSGAIGMDLVNAYHRGGPLADAGR
jgi:hypothetical protein